MFVLAAEAVEALVELKLQLGNVLSIFPEEEWHTFPPPIFL